MWTADRSEKLKLHFEISNFNIKNPNFIFFQEISIYTFEFNRIFGGIVPFSPVSSVVIKIEPIILSFRKGI